MKIRNVTPTGFEIVSGGQAVFLLLGLPFLLFGLVFFYLLASGKLGEGNAVLYYGLVAAFVLFGFGMSFGRRGTTVDRMRGSICTWYGLIVPMVRKYYHFNDFERITLQNVRIGEKNRRPWIVTRVQLCGKVTLSIGSAEKYEEARSLAERLSEMLNLKVEDSSTGTTVVRDPGQVARNSLRHAAKEAESRPTSMDSTVERSGTSLQITVPASKEAQAIVTSQKFLFWAGTIVVIGVWVGINIFVVQAGAFGYAFALFPVIIVALKAPSILRETAFLAPEVKLSITKSELSLVESSGKYSRNSETRTATVEEVFVGEGQETPLGLLPAPIYIRSDTATIAFGAHLAEEEKRYLVSIIRNAIQEF